jgi:hypothetical protein
MQIKKFKYNDEYHFENAKKWLIYNEHVQIFNNYEDTRDDFIVIFDIYYNKYQNFPDFFSFNYYAQPNNVNRAFDELKLELTEFLDIDYQSFSDDVKLLFFVDE